MAATVHVTRSTDHAMDLLVTVAGREITVGPGPLLVYGSPQTFPGDSVAIQERAAPTVVQGFLAQDHGDGDRIVLLVSEYVLDGVDVPWEYQRGDRYEPWATLFQIEVPAGPGALAAVDYHTWRMVPPENPTKEA